MAILKVCQPGSAASFHCYCCHLLFFTAGMWISWQVSLTLNYLSPPPRDIHLLEWLVKQCSLPRQLSESWMEESGMFLYNIFYVSQSKNISSLLIIFLLKIKMFYWVLVTLTYTISSKITWNRFPFSTLFAIRSVAKLLGFI